MMLADVIMQAAERTGGDPFTLGWLMRQPEVQETGMSEAHAMSVLREMSEAGMVRTVTRHPAWRWAVCPQSGD
jgi:hypothetical protein